MPTFFLNYWKPLFIGFLAITFGIGCFRQGEKSVQTKWDLANAQATVKAEEVEQKNAIFSNKIGEKYETKLQTIDDTYRAALASLQQPTSGNLPASTNSTSKPDVPTCSNQLHQAHKQARLELARQAEINTERLVELQAWVRGVK